MNENFISAQQTVPKKDLDENYILNFVVDAFGESRLVQPWNYLPGTSNRSREKSDDLLPEGSFRKLT